MVIKELVDTECGDVIVELKDMSFKELQAANRAFNKIQNMISDLMADEILKKGE